MTNVEMPAYLEIRTPDTNDLVVRFNRNGTLDIGPGFRPDEAGKKAAEIMAEWLAKFARAQAIMESDPTIQMADAGRKDLSDIQ